MGRAPLLVGENDEYLISLLSNSALMLFTKNVLPVPVLMPFLAGLYGSA
jgi:hypothetical protein